LRSLVCSSTVHAAAATASGGAGSLVLVDAPAQDIHPHRDSFLDGNNNNNNNNDTPFVVLDLARRRILAARHWFKI
jgi:hypothetical protein